MSRFFQILLPGKGYLPTWMRPIVNQWPLMLAYIILIGWSSLTSHPFYRWFLIFLHAYLVAWLVQLFHSKVVKGMVYLLLFVFFLTELILSSCFLMTISPTVLTLVGETNARESAEFFQSVFAHPKFASVVGIAALMLVLTVLAEWKRTVVVKLLSRRPVVRGLAVVSALLLVGGFLFSYCYITLTRCQTMAEIEEWQSHRRHPADAVTKLYSSLLCVHRTGREMEMFIEQVRQVKAVPQADADSVNVVFVIGESYIKKHTPLYGYPLQTTPFLSAEQKAGRLFAFTDVVAPYNQTSRVVRNLFSCNSLGDHESWSSKPPLTAVFKKNGFYVTMYDNQKAFGVSDWFAFSLNTYLYDPSLLDSCYHEMNDSSYFYDEGLIDAFMRKPRKAHPCRLAIFHLMGQHVMPHERYPHSGTVNYHRFTADSIRRFRHESWLTDKMYEMIAEYDNATLYNDEVMRRIIGLYDNENTVVVYLSDHGEEVYDYRARYGRASWDLDGDYRQTLEWQYCVPLMVWCSDKYQKCHPKVMDMIRHSLNKPLMLDNTCHLLFHLAGINTPYYIKERDVLSPDYHCPPRLVNDKIDLSAYFH